MTTRPAAPVTLLPAQAELLARAATNAAELLTAADPARVAEKAGESWVGVASNGRGIRQDIAGREVRLPWETVLAVAARIADERPDLLADLADARFAFLGALGAYWTSEHGSAERAEAEHARKVTGTAVAAALRECLRVVVRAPRGSGMVPTLPRPIAAEPGEHRGIVPGHRRCVCGFAGADGMDLARHIVREEDAAPAVVESPAPAVVDVEHADAMAQRALAAGDAAAAVDVRRAIAAGELDRLPELVAACELVADREAARVARVRAMRAERDAAGALFPSPAAPAPRPVPAPVPVEVADLADAGALFADVREAPARVLPRRMVRPARRTSDRVSPAGALALFAVAAGPEHVAGQLDIFA